MLNIGVKAPAFRLPDQNGELRTTYVIDEQGIIVYANDKVKAAEDAAKMLENMS